MLFRSQALLTPGEAVIGPKLAKKIGYAKLNRMNQADKNGIGKYASGGDGRSRTAVQNLFRLPSSNTVIISDNRLPVKQFSNICRYNYLTQEDI